jgi:hypothetical protein
VGGDTYENWRERGACSEADAAEEPALEPWQHEPKLVVSDGCYSNMLDVIDGASVNL